MLESEEAETTNVHAQGRVRRERLRSLVKNESRARWKRGAAGRGGLHRPAADF